MGNRSHIVVQSEGSAAIVLYGHWAGGRNVSTVVQAESIGARMRGDAAYLAATLFHLFSTHPNSGYPDSPTLGYGIWSEPDLEGISPEVLDWDAPPVYVNADTGEYRVGEPWEMTE